MALRSTSPTKRETTRRRIVSAAARAYRQHGIDGVGVRDIMKRAGLTQGGFYFHFPDKNALFEEASRDAATSLAELLVAMAEQAPPGEQLRAFIDGYLSVEHRDHPESGCMMSALGNDVARRDKKVRAAFTESSTILLKRLAPYVRGASENERIESAGLLLSSMAGVLMVSRVLSDPRRSEALLSRARRFYFASFAPA